MEGLRFTFHATLEATYASQEFAHITVWRITEEVWIRVTGPGHDDMDAYVQVMHTIGKRIKRLISEN